MNTNSPAVEPVDNIFPEGHPLHGANLFRSRPRSIMISDAVAAVRNLLSSGEVRAAYDKMVDAFQKPASISTQTTTSPMKTRNLTLAALAAIGKFHAQKLNFSAHDVTVSLRDAVENRTLNISDAPQDFESPSGALVARVEHDRVRQIVRDIFEDGLVPDYVPGVKQTGFSSFVQYQRPDAVGEVQRQQATPSTQPTPVPASTQPTPVPASTQLSAPAPSVSDAEIESAILIYVDRKLAHSQQPTLKKIQSRLKRTPATCDEIRAVLIKNGYQIQPNPLAPSRDSVISKY